MKLNILLVEDNVDCANLLQHKLKSAGIDCDFKEMRSCSQAFEYLNHLRKKPNASRAFDLIVLDWYLNEERGLDFLKKIKKDDTYKSIPIIVHTSSDTKQDLSEAYKFGGTVFIPKNAEASMFKEAIQHMQITGLIERRSE